MLFCEQKGAGTGTVRMSNASNKAVCFNVIFTTVFHARHVCLFGFCNAIFNLQFVSVNPITRAISNNSVNVHQSLYAKIQSSGAFKGNDAEDQGTATTPKIEVFPCVSLQRKKGVGTPYRCVASQKNTGDQTKSLMTLDIVYYAP